MNREGSERNKRSVWTVTTQPFKDAHFATFPPALIEPCILAGCPAGGTVLDPFGGAGTTGLVADRHHRNAILIELNPDPCPCQQRMGWPFPMHPLWPYTAQQGWLGPKCGAANAPTLQQCPCSMTPLTPTATMGASGEKP